MTLPPIHELRSLFHYNPLTGAITYLQQRGPRKPGDPAGSTQSGIPHVYINGRQHRAAAIAWVRQVAPPAPVVVPVAKAERLPGEGDCDAEGRCWVYMPRRATPTPNWTLLWKGHLQPYHSHWLPAHAIPLPQAGEGEG